MVTKNSLKFCDLKFKSLNFSFRQITQNEDVNQFLIEFSGFLKEVMCPYEVLVHSHAQNKMLTVESRYLLLEYLISELMGVKMSISIKPKDDTNVITLVSFHFPNMNEIYLISNLIFRMNHQQQQP